MQSHFKSVSLNLKRLVGMSSEEIKGGNVMVSSNSLKKIFGKSNIVDERKMGHPDSWNGPAPFPKRRGCVSIQYQIPFFDGSGLLFAQASRKSEGLPGPYKRSRQDRTDRWS